MFHSFGYLSPTPYYKQNQGFLLRHVRPYGVDVSSGVEREKGRKDHERLRLFIERARGAAGTD
jgi:phosphoribosylanthranilate isomerase